MTSAPRAWSDTIKVASDKVVYDPAKKTVFIVADYKMTELFDMLAPYYLFNETKKANVYIVAKDNTPILIKRDLYVKPQLTFDQIKAMGIGPDVIVIPALSARGKDQDSSLITWLRHTYNANTRILAVCDGAATAAATGWYDGKQITCHASDFKGIKHHFPSATWVQNVSVTHTEKLYSTAGVSNAVEGSLTLIKELLGEEEMKNIIKNVNYPYSTVKVDHNSVPVNGRHKRTAFKKIFFRKNKNLGVMVSDGVGEFALATVLDTYGRTFPSSLTTFLTNDSIVQTKYGLSLIFTGIRDAGNVDELHVLDSLSNEDALLFKRAKIIRHNNFENEYPLDACLRQIRNEYGQSFEELVKVSLDYN